MKIKKIEYLSTRKDTGCLTVGEHHNFRLASGVFVKNSADGRGSNIETIGGNSSGFTELDDIYYFARKLYRALKYPSSRVTAEEERGTRDNMFGGNQTAEITRDEVKWSKFLERQQNRFCKDFAKLFLLHLDFKGLTKQYGLNSKNIHVSMKSPSNYKEQMEQNFLQTRLDNYVNFTNQEEISKYYAMKKFLDWDEDEVKENVSGFTKDRELGLVKDESSGSGGY